MGPTAIQDKDSAFKKQLEKIIRRFSRRPMLVGAAKSLLSALGYDDEVLVESNLDALCEGLRDLFVILRVQHSSGVQELVDLCKTIREWLRQHPRENYDEMGDDLSHGVDSLLKMGGCLCEMAKELGEVNYKPDNISALEDDIRRLETLKEAIMKNWPWTTEEPPLVDREMVARSRAAIKQGNFGESIQEAINRLNAASPGSAEQ